MTMTELIPARRQPAWARLEGYAAKAEGHWSDSSFPPGSRHPMEPDQLLGRLLVTRDSLALSRSRRSLAGAPASPESLAAAQAGSLPGPLTVP